MSWVNFLYRWQTLIGSGLGPFLAVMFSATGFWLKSLYEVRKARKEAHRRIEIAISRSLNDAFVLREQLKWIADRIQELVREARSITDPKVFFMNRVNFPSMREIYSDRDIAAFRVSSYYIHNKLLFIDAGIKEANDAVAGLKNDFEEILRQNALLTSLMRDNPNPPMQRQTYADNLESFALAIKDYASKSLSDGIKTMVQVKVYNNQLREPNGYRTHWKHEGTRFKFFWTKTEQRNYRRNLESLDEIDATIEKEVAASIARAEKRAAELKTT